MLYTDTVGVVFLKKGGEKTNKVYMITYDLDSPGQRYDGLIEAIKESSNGVYCSYWKSSFLIQSGKSAKEIMESLVPFLDQNDRIIVIEVVKHYHGRLDSDAWEYIHAML